MPLDDYRILQIALQIGAAILVVIIGIALQQSISNLAAARLNLASR